MINLMPADIKEEIKFARHNVSLIQYCILAAIVSFALAAIMLFGLILMNRDQNIIQSAIDSRQSILVELDKTDAEAQAFADNVSTISSLLDRELNFSQVVVQIAELIPNGATLSRLDLPNDVKTAPFPLSVEVNDQSLAGVLQQNFEQSEIFEGADVQNIRPAESTDDGVVLTYNVDLIVSFVKTKQEAAPKPASNAPGSNGSAPANGDGN